MSIRWPLALIALLFGGLPGPGAPLPARAEEDLLVFAAASLADALAEVGEAYETAEAPRAAGGGRVSFNFAASNVLARQIAAGAPADLFLSADLAQLQAVEEAGRARPGERLALLGNRLVVVVPAASPVRSLAGPRELPRFERLALADPEGVPAGVYARRWLVAEGLWEGLAGRVVPALDVRAALAAVAAGNLPAGVVYATDAATSRRVRVVYSVPPEKGPTITYYAAPVGEEHHSDLPAFLAFLQSPAAGRIFTRYGFRFLPADG